MLTEKQKLIHTEFRKFLREEKQRKNSMLNSLINAAEKHLPALIKKYVRDDFECLYNDIYSIEDLLLMESSLNTDEIKILPQGYISSVALNEYIQFFAKKNNIDLTTVVVSNNEEIEEKRQLLEGRVTEALVLRRQRNRMARQKCLEDSGYTCYVCGLNFEQAYGEIGKGFMEVHHTKPISTYDNEHPIPLSELCALCSNCHSMVHRKREVLDVDVLKNKYTTINSDKLLK